VSRWPEVMRQTVDPTAFFVRRRNYYCNAVIFVDVD
jgi:hypothetical protein